MTKQQWCRWHSLAGFPLAVLLCFIMLTGTLAVVSHELDWLSNPAIRASATTAPIDWPRYYRAALAASHGDQIYLLSVPEHQGFSAQVLLYDNDKQLYRQFIDPQTYQHTGNGAWFNWQTTLRRIHRHLMMPLNVGLPIVTLTAFPLLLSLVSGLVLHPSWWKGLWRLPRSHNARVLWGDVHRLTGLWSSWLLLIVAATGAWYFAEKYGLGATYPPDGKVVSEQAITQSATVSPAVFDSVISTVHSERPELSVKTIFFPISPGQPVRVDGQADNLLVRDRANNMIFDPVTGELLSRREASALSMHVRIAEAADPLHFGIWGGYWSKGLYFVFGMLMTSLSVTGTIIYAHRVKKWRRSDTPGLGTQIGAGIREMKKGAMISAMLITVCAGLTLYVLVN